MENKIPMFLMFEKFATSTSEFLLAKIPGFDSYYCIWYERSISKFRVSDLEKNHHDFETMKEAKEFSQKDFEIKVFALFEDFGFNKWKKDTDFDHKMPNSLALELYNAFDEEDKN